MPFLEEKYPNLKNASFEEKYDFLIDKIGLRILRSWIPISDESIKETYAKDKNLNNIPLEDWDRWTGASATPTDVSWKPYNLRTLIAEKTGVTTFSLAECVCLLKQTATRSIKQKGE
ncbi:hypothetical protein [Mogibacterium diversum]|uniref:hypothetical protein n=1 Tax=Mogibacterium diversum TaxID=114527 RepID=UPI0028D62473|nr:hypothetical protein [Mogibacterium diversum]